VSYDNWLALGIAVLTGGYLVVALIFPEKL
jgi:K+-transporting ATPase KdpF subunit